MPNGRSVTVHELRVTSIQREATVMAGIGLPSRMTGPSTGNAQSGGRIAALMSVRKVAIIP
jgi:hypothetical protein